MQETRSHPWVREIPGGGGGSPPQRAGLGSLTVRGACWAATTGARVKHDSATKTPPPPLTRLNLSLIRHFQHANPNSTRDARIPALLKSCTQSWLLLAKAPQAACDQATPGKYQSRPHPSFSCLGFPPTRPNMCAHLPKRKPKVAASLPHLWLTSSFVFRANLY